MLEQIDRLLAGGRFRRWQRERIQIDRVAGGERRLRIEALYSQMNARRGVWMN